RMRMRAPVGRVRDLRFIRRGGRKGFGKGVGSSEKSLGSASANPREGRAAAEHPRIHCPAGGGCMVRVFPVRRGGAPRGAGALAAGLAGAQTSQTAQTAAGSKEAMKDTIVKLENELAGKYGEAERPRIRRGIDQAAEFWRPSDGNAAAFEEVVRRYVASD